MENFFVEKALHKMRLRQFDRAATKVLWKLKVKIFQVKWLVNDLIVIRLLRQDSKFRSLRQDPKF